MGVRNYNYAGLGYFADVGSVLLATFGIAWFAWETKDTALWKGADMETCFLPFEQRRKSAKLHQRGALNCYMRPDEKAYVCVGVTRHGVLAC